MIISHYQLFYHIFSSGIFSDFYENVNNFLIKNISVFLGYKNILITQIL